MNLPWSRTRLGVAAGIVAGSAGLALVSGLGPAQSLLPVASARGADDSPSTTVDDRGNDTVPTTAPGTTTPLPGTTRVVDAAGAGTVTIAVGNDTLRLVAATPAAGWNVEVEQAAGSEIEVDFRRGGERVQVNVEIEDGAVRERIRVRDDAGTDIRIENGVIVRADEPDARGDDDNSGPGSANSGPGSVSSGHGDDDRAGDDHDGTVEPGDDHGGADEPGDDHGGDRVDNSGSGHGGADDPAGDDHGGDD